MIESFRDLRVWRLGMKLVEDTYRVTRTFPRSEAFGLATQMQRSAVSVPSNIAEGHCRAYTREYIHHVAIASGSIAELQTQVELAVRLGYIDPAVAVAFVQSADSLARQLKALRTALSRRVPNSPLPTPSSHNVP